MSCLWGMLNKQCVIIKYQEVEQHPGTSLFTGATQNTQNTANWGHSVPQKQQNQGTDWRIMELIDLDEQPLPYVQIFTSSIYNVHFK